MIIALYRALCLFNEMNFWARQSIPKSRNEENSGFITCFIDTGKLIIILSLLMKTRANIAMFAHQQSERLKMILMEMSGHPLPVIWMTVGGYDRQIKSKPFVHLVVITCSMPIDSMESVQTGSMSSIVSLNAVASIKREFATKKLFFHPSATVCIWTHPMVVRLRLMSLTMAITAS